MANRNSYLQDTGSTGHATGQTSGQLTSAASVHAHTPFQQTPRRRKHTPVQRCQNSTETPQGAMSAL
eukprot:4791039-Amphidinium_carterae.1